MVGEDAHGFAGGEVVHSYCAVEGGGDDLRVGGLRYDRGDCLFVAGEDVDVAACTHVPDSDDTIATAGAEDVQGGVEGESVDAREVTVVMPDHLVGLEIPALDHLVLGAGEEVRVTGGDGQPAHAGDVPREGEFECSCGEIPDLDRAVAGTRSEPLITRLHGQRSHPAEMSRNYSEKLPGRMPLRSLLPYRVSPY